MVSAEAHHGCQLPVYERRGATGSPADCADLAPAALSFLPVSGRILHLSSKLAKMRPDAKGWGKSWQRPRNCMLGTSSCGAINQCGASIPLNPAPYFASSLSHSMNLLPHWARFKSMASKVRVYRGICHTRMWPHRYTPWSGSHPSIRSAAWCYFGGSFLNFAWVTVNTFSFLEAVSQS